MKFQFLANVLIGSIATVVIGCGTFVPPAGLGSKDEQHRSRGDSAALTETRVAEVEFLFVPNGFDDNDRAQVVLDGWLHSSCEQAVKPEYKVNMPSRTIEIQAIIESNQEVCLPFLRRFESVVDLGVLPEGDYRVVTNNYQLMRPLIVSEAPSAGPDTEVYAQIDQVEVVGSDDVETGIEMIIRGRIPMTCLQWVRLEINDSGETIEVLPVLAEDGSPCLADDRSFELSRQIDKEIDESRYLLHVRSFDGNAINRVFAPADLR